MIDGLPMKNKTALIVSGGGMRAVFCVGALLALQEQFGFTNPDIVISGSGSTGTTSYFVARQYTQIKTIWLSLLSTKKFVNFRRIWKIMDIDYLIDVVFRKQEPLLVKNIYNSAIDYYIGATNAKRGIVEYFHQKDGVDVFESMRASKAIPFFYGKSVCINGKTYHDGSNSSAVELHIQKALSLGADRIIVLDSHTKFSPWILTIRLFFKSSPFKKGFMEEYNERHMLARQFSKNKHIFFCTASELSLSAMNNNKKNLASAFLTGYDEILKNKNIITSFLS